MKAAPAATGISTKPTPFAPRTAIIGLAPAGGCTVLVVIIKNIANPTARPTLRKEKPSIENTKTPDRADSIWPNRIFFGCAKGLS